MGSISHSVAFQVSSKDSVLEDGVWWTQEVWTPTSGGGRGIHGSRIWDSNVIHVASTWQDGLTRRANSGAAQKQKMQWLEGMERAGRLCKDEVNGVEKPKL